MRAAVFKAVGQPLAIEQRPDPTPGEGEVVLKVARCGICGTDLAMSDGSGQTFEANSIIGHEFAGEIVAIGPKVERLKVGDRIAAMPFTGCGKCATCLAGRPNFCVAVPWHAGRIRRIHDDGGARRRQAAVAGQSGRRCA